MVYSKRLELVQMLLETDPDVLVSDLGISAQELLLAFPKKVAAYVEREASPDEPLTDEELEATEIDDDSN